MEKASLRVRALGGGRSIRIHHEQSIARSRCCRGASELDMGPGLSLNPAHRQAIGYLYLLVEHSQVQKALLRHGTYHIWNYPRSHELVPDPSYP
jgi:hypothetical protein